MSENKVAELLQGFGKVYPEWDEGLLTTASLKANLASAEFWLLFVCLSVLNSVSSSSFYRRLWLGFL
ncbi:hypothetical protein C1H46_042379 [Malus baccata]|uniref:Uncharacterized protein n=1 Tax=Malus baccata TaxID=106549 RepID=A0A540KDQ4_MALBA|nr:hypothetical protein C1H46_042379 [Malus baccata]